MWNVLFLFSFSLQFSLHFSRMDYFMISFAFHVNMTYIWSLSFDIFGIANIRTFPLLRQQQRCVVVTLTLGSMLGGYTVLYIFR